MVIREIGYIKEKGSNMYLESLTDEELKKLEERYGDLNDPNTRIILNAMGEAFNKLAVLLDITNEFMLSRAGEEEVKDSDGI
jgi:hypothetical protein